jgi:Transposase domain (DUF772)
MKWAHNITERTIFMSNQTTIENHTTQMTLFPEEEARAKKTSKRQLSPTFKPYDNRQIQMIFDIEALIPENHVARVVDEMVEAVPDEQLFSHYKGGGRSSYHPKMMLKIILYGYSQKVYSCRGIETLTKVKSSSYVVSFDATTWFSHN